MKAKTVLLQIAKAITESVFPKKKHSSVIEHIHEKEIHDLLTIIRNRDHTALLPYNNKPIKHLLYAIKYENHKKSVNIASDILSEHMYEEIQEEETIHAMHYIMCTIPTTKERRNKNGYNHMHLLLSETYKKLPNNKVLYKKDLLRWTRETQRQSSIRQKTKRMQNMHRAMEVKNILPPNTVCFVIDDVTTTGATLTEAKRALTEAQAGTVITVALAH